MPTLSHLCVRQFWMKSKPKAGPMGSFEPDAFGHGKTKIDAARATIRKRNIQCDWDAVALERQRRAIRYQNALNGLTGIYNSMIA